MVTPTVGTVVLVSFPFSDLSHSKLRPAVVTAHVGRDDWILCQITSKPLNKLLKPLWTFSRIALNPSLVSK
jgi:hypothetical protein